MGDYVTSACRRIFCRQTEQGDSRQFAVTGRPTGLSLDYCKSLLSLNGVYVGQVPFREAVS